MLLTPALAQAQGNWSAAWFIGRHNSGPVVQTTLTTISAILGHPKWSLDLGAFAGANWGTQTPFGGFDLTHQFNLAANVNGFAGLGWSVASGKPTDVGLVAGLAIKF